MLETLKEQLEARLGCREKLTNRFHDALRKHHTPVYFSALLLVFLPVYLVVFNLARHEMTTGLEWVIALLLIIPVVLFAGLYLIYAFIFSHIGDSLFKF